MTTHRYTEASITIDGQPFDIGPITKITYEPRRVDVGEMDRNLGASLSRTYEATATMVLEGDARPWLEWMDRYAREADARRQLIERLVRRLSYANRKGRRALRRLLAMREIEAVVLP